jgi:hypothetical protein
MQMPDPVNQMTIDPIDECERAIRAQSGVDGLRAVVAFLHALPADATIAWGDDGQWTPTAILALELEERANA